MRFTIARNAGATVRDLAAALDGDQPIAETSRRVGEAAVRLGLPRPSYANVRRLVLAERRRRAELREIREAVLADLGAGRVPHLPVVLERLREAQSAGAIEPCVSETQGVEGER